MSFDPYEFNDWPRYITVGRFDYRVIISERLCEEHGYMDPVKKEIVLQYDAPETMWRTLVHEILEAVNHEYRIRLSHDAIEDLEDGLAQVFGDMLEVDDDDYEGFEDDPEAE